MKKPLRKKILFISYYFHPASMAAAQRMTSFAQAAGQGEFDVHIIAPSCMDGAYPDDFTQHYDSSNIYIHKAWSPDLSILRQAKEKNQRLSKSNTGNLFQALYEKIFFPDKGFIWARSAYRLAVKLHKTLKFTAVISSSPLISAHWAALRVKHKLSVPWLCDIRDFYATNNSVLLGNKQKAIKLESTIFNSADHFLFVSKMMQQVYELNYPHIEDRTTIVLNGANTDELQNITAYKPESSKGIRIIFYAGTFYNGLRNPIPFLSQMNQLLKEEKFNKDTWEIHIAGQLESHLLLEFKHEPVMHILRLLGPIPRTEVLARMKSADAFLLIVPDLDSHRDTIPAKVFEYMYFRKPILAYVPKRSAVMDLLHHSKSFYRIPSEVSTPPKALHNALMSTNISNDNPTSFLYDRKLQAAKFLVALKTMIARKS